MRPWFGDDFQFWPGKQLRKRRWDFECCQALNNRQAAPWQLDPPEVFSPDRRYPEDSRNLLRGYREEE